MEDISAGNIIQITVIMFGIVAGFIKMKSSNEQNQQEIKQQREKLEKLEIRQTEVETANKLAAQATIERDKKQAHMMDSIDEVKKDVTTGREEMLRISAKMDILIDKQNKA